MSGQELAMGYIDSFNRRDVHGWAAHFAEHAVLHDPFYPEPVRGRSAIEASQVSIDKAFSDMRWTLLRPVIDLGTRVAGEMSVRGTNDGPLEMPDGSALPASGREISFQTGFFWELSPEGLITEERSYFDATGVAAQLGITG